jgi:UDP-N-acetylglucosamine--N-acetylmuramyl-(pentapeptide) pyrophosphoryl-undecaprenol N-acetylglucosamine transferase
MHQSGKTQIEQLRSNYSAAGVQAELTPFIEDTAHAMADADLVICRAGASTVTEVAAIGAAAVFVPFPAAVDDHQTTNARFLADQQGGWLVSQADLTPDRLARMLSKADRPTLQAAATAAKKMAKAGATERIVAACESWAARRKTGKRVSGAEK